MKMKWLLLMFLGLLCVHAEAEDVTGKECIFSVSGIETESLLTDGDMQTAQKLDAGAELTVVRAEGIGSLYLIFDREYDEVILTDVEYSHAAAVPVMGILHKWIDLQACFGRIPDSVTIRFPEAGALCELRLFSPGEVPDWVQKWDVIPDGGADLLLCSAHGDDEQLFFAGLLPWYAAEKNCRVQVVYFTDHRNMTGIRVHEMLDGLWAVGVRDYPVFGSFPDYYTFDMDDASRFYAESGITREKLLAFVVEQLRRYQPLVAVGHDVNGEYGHGMHKLYTDLLCEAVQLSGEADSYPELAEQYGTWEVPKVYLHLYPDNPIVMDWDVPMEAFDGKTPYEVTKNLGFPCHASQQKDFAWYFRDAATAADVAKYSPCCYGLYHTTVGEDTQKNDFLENISRDPLPTEPPPESLETLPSRERTMSHTEQNWPLIPAVGTVVLTILTLTLSLPEAERKNRKI